MPPKRARSVPRENPTHSEAAALIQNPMQQLSETSGSHSIPVHNDQENDLEEYQREAISTYQNEEEITRLDHEYDQHSSSSSSVPYRDIVLGNVPSSTLSLTTSVSREIVSGNSILNTVPSEILQMGNVVNNDTHDSQLPKRAAETTHQTVFNMKAAVTLNDVVDESLARRFLVQARDNAFTGHWSTFIQKTALRLIRFRLYDHSFRTLVPKIEIDMWPLRPPDHPKGLEYSMLQIAEIIFKIYAPETAPNVKSIEQRCRECPFEYDMLDQMVEEKFLNLYLQTIDNHYLGVTLDPIQDDILAKEFYKKIPKNTGMAKIYAEQTAEEIGKGLDTAYNACARAKNIIALVRQSIRISSSYGPNRYVYRIDSRDKETIAPYDHTIHDRLPTPNEVTAKTPPHVDRCECCGQWGHLKNRCRWANHPLANNSEKAWKNSHSGGIWASVGADKFMCNKLLQNHPVVKKNDFLLLDNDYNRRNPNKHQKMSSSTFTGIEPRNFENYTSSSTQAPVNGTQQRSKFLPRIVTSTITDDDRSEFLIVTVSLNEQLPTTLNTDLCQVDCPSINPSLSSTVGVRGAKAPIRAKTTTRAKALLDTGCLPGNFISLSLLRKLNGSDSVRRTDYPIRVCSGLDNHCIDSLDVVDILISFEAKNKNHLIPLTCRISQRGAIDLIIGRETIKKYNLVSILPNFFFDEILAEYVRDISPCRHANEAIALHGCDIDAKAAALANGPYNGLSPLTVGSDYHGRSSSTKRVHFDDTPLIDEVVVATLPVPSDTPAQTWGPIATVLRQTEQLSEVDIVGADEIDNDKKDTFGPFREPDIPTDILSDEEFLSKIVVEGNAELQADIKKLLLEFKDIFSDKLRAKSADIPPFDLEVDKKMWETYRNRGPVRVQTKFKQEEIQRQTQQMLAAGIIEVSPASFYSQVMIATKPGGFRFCIDFRNLNDATASASWPIPNIQQMIIRIGAHRCSIFAIMDLTLGYHQAPISLATRIFTAFITFAGIFQFTRLPFGPKRAPSYFQEMMASVILAGLIYFICEVYLDDIIVFADSPTQFIERLRMVFTRFRLKNICLKASKCKFGLSKIEYVGRTISKDGVSMSTKKINSVLDFPKPTVNTQLRSFLGLANYFKDFVPNHSNVVSPLFKMIDHSAKKQTPLKWTSEGEAAFAHVRQLISDSPILYFLDDKAPIFLMTDASDYGIGGYLYQVIGEEKQLVSLVSKSLTSTQLAWSVIQKEAYAIFFCCTHLDNLLRDRKFTILTDHKNLTFIKQASNPMIVRWHLALQELDFKILFVPGVDNNIADAMSRLCTNNKPVIPISVLSAIHGPYIISEEVYKQIGFVHNAMVGHGGVERTLQKLKNLNFIWKNMRLDVKQYIRECPCCQKMSQIKIPINAYKYTTSTYRPMECLNIDFIGPYPDKGYVLNIIDTFTRWVELYPVPHATAEEACKCLLIHFGRYGSPTVIRSDKGAHFANSLIQQFLSATSTLQNLTLAYSSQENAIVERNNKEINRHLRALTFDTNTIDNYQQLLPFVQRIMNSSYNARTKVSPADLLFGNSVDLSGGIYNSIVPHTPNTNTQSESMDKMIKMQTHLIEISKKILEDSDKEHNSSNSSSITEFQKNSYVLVQQRSSPDTRLHTLWRGPLKVIDFKQGQYTLLDLTTNKEKEYHSTQMKEFIFNPLRTIPSDVSRKDYLEFFIETILSHSGNPKRISTLKFKIKWLGYDDTYNSWEPWSSLRQMEILHKYLIEHNMSNIIPRKFRENYPPPL